MSRVVSTPDYYVQQKQNGTALARLGRKTAATPLKDVDTTELTSAQIDVAVFGQGKQTSIGAQAANGLLIMDSTNGLLAVRQNGAWYKTSLTVID